MVVECRAPSLGTFGDLNKLLQLGHQSEPPAVKAVCTQKLMALIVHIHILSFSRACAIYARARDLSFYIGLIILVNYNTKIPSSLRLEAIGRNTPSTYAYTTDRACSRGGISRRVALPDSHILKTIPYYYVKPC